MTPSLLLLSWLGCAARPPEVPAGDVRLVGGEVVGVGPVDLMVRGGRFVDPALGTGDEAALDLSGRFLAPAFIDSHVHLAYFPVAAELSAGGVAAAVDLASPESYLAEEVARPTLLRAGPMITAVRGYPTQGWGADGYGIECGDPASCAEATAALIDAGADLVKVPVTGPPTHDDATLRAIVDAAHARERKVAVHALDDTSAQRAAAAGADVLAHTPTGRLSEATIAAWRGRAVISTLGAFGGENAAANLRDLAAVDAVVLYGTDLGNTRTPAIDARELAALRDAGFSPAEILSAATASPAAYWGLTALGALLPGQSASFLVLDEDPLADPTAFARPAEVWMDGRRLP